MRVFVTERSRRHRSVCTRRQAGLQLRHLRPSVPTLEDVFARAVGEE